jgi:hypothetical protein
MPTNLDLSRPIRGKIIAALKADAALAAMVTGIFPQTVGEADFPWIKMGAPTATPQFIDGGDGTRYSAAVHCFTKRTAATPDPDSQAMDINAEVVRVLNAMEDIAIGSGLTLDVFPRQAQVMQDGDADSFHGFVTFEAIAS